MYRMDGEFIDSHVENQEMLTLAFDPEETEGIESCLCAQLLLNVYYSDNHFICQDCFDLLDPDDQDLYDDQPSHFLCGIPASTRISYCNICDIDIAELQPAISCIRCTNVYDDLTHLERDFLVRGTITRAVVL